MKTAVAVVVALACLTRTLSANADLYLELVVNGVPTGLVINVVEQDGHYRLDPDDLRAARLPVAADATERVAVDQLEGVTVTYDALRQRLELAVPPAWLPSHTLRVGTARERTAPTISSGAIFNYDVYAAAPTGSATSVSLWTEGRAFGRWGTLTTTGLAQPAASSVRASGRGWLRYDTTWSLADEDRALTYAAGDVTTGALAWTTAVRLGGVTIARNFRVRPDIVTYPLPQFAGQAAVPTTVDLFVNGARVTSEAVAPGPFTINQEPFVNGAGTATIVTTDALGRQTSSTMSFYVTNALLQRGLGDYSVSAGAMRHGFGLRSFGYGAPAVTATGRRGLTRRLTVEGHAEATGMLGLGGAGVTVGAGRFGVVSFSDTVSRFDDRGGQQLAVGYGYTAPRFSVNLQRLQRSTGFADLTQVPTAGARAPLPRRMDQATGALNFGRRGGTLGVGYFGIDSADGRATRLLNVSYNRAVRERTTLYVSLTRDRAAAVSAQAQLTVSLGPQGNVSLVTTRGGGHAAVRTQYNRSVPTDGGVGWNIGYASGATPYRQVDASWRSAYALASGGIYGSGEAQTRWGSVAGSAVIMDGRVLPANRVSDAFVLIDTDGQPGVPVLFENQRVGETDRRGHLLVPWVNAYYPAKYQIDPLALSPDLRIGTVEQRVAVRARSGAVVHFPIAVSTSLLLSLVDASGAPLTLGRVALDRVTGQQAVVGWDGLVYLENPGERLDLHVAGAPACDVAPIDVTRLRRDGRSITLTCR